MINLLLGLFEVAMLIHAGKLWIRRRRPSRLAFVVFWFLLVCIHYVEMKELYPFAFAAFVAAMVLLRRERSLSSGLLDVDVDKPKASAARPGLYDRDVDG